MIPGTSRRPDRAARTPRPEREHVLFVHAHPDDESIVTGGTIAKLVRDGVPVTVLTCTRGERGEVIPAELRHLEGDLRALADHRETELAAAMAALGVTDQQINIAGSQVVFGLLSDHVAARELLAGAGAVVLLYAGLWWLAARRVPPPVPVEV